jgi:small subunit ribosomal protein S6
MVLYELLWMVSRNAKAVDVKQLVQRTAATVIGRGGIMKKVQSLGHHELAYDFRTKGERHKSVRHITLEMECSPSTLSEVNSGMRHEPNVLRWFALRKDVKLVEKPRRIKKAPVDEFAAFELATAPDVPREQWQTIPIRRSVEDED